MFLCREGRDELPGACGGVRGSLASLLGSEPRPARRGGKGSRRTRFADVGSSSVLRDAPSSPFSCHPQVKERERLAVPAEFRSERPVFMSVQASCSDALRNAAVCVETQKLAQVARRRSWSGWERRAGSAGAAARTARGPGSEGLGSSGIRAQLPRSPRRRGRNGCSPSLFKAGKRKTGAFKSSRCKLNYKLPRSVQ